MNELPIVETLRLDPLPTATMVEMVVGDYLREPEKGIYFKGKLAPVMYQGNTYHQHRLLGGKKSAETFVVNFIEELDSRFPVMNLDGDVVVTPNQIPFLAYQPVLPVQGLKIVEATLRGVLEFYGNGHNSSVKTSTPTQLYADYLAPILMQEQQEVAEHVVDQITGIVAEFRSQVRNFCGEDKWVIHFFRERLGTFFIEKSVDWRIVEYYHLKGLSYGK